METAARRRVLLVGAAAVVLVMGVLFAAGDYPGAFADCYSDGGREQAIASWHRYWIPIAAIGGTSALGLLAAGVRRRFRRSSVISVLMVVTLIAMAVALLVPFEPLGLLAVPGGVLGLAWVAVAVAIGTWGAVAAAAVLGVTLSFDWLQGRWSALVDGLLVFATYAGLCTMVLASYASKNAFAC